MNATQGRVNMNSLAWWYVLKTSWRYLCKTYWWCLEDFFKTSWRSVEDNPQDVLKTFWRRLKDVLARRLEDVLKKFLQDILKTSWKLLEDEWPRRIYWHWPTKTSWRRLKDVFRRCKPKANIFVLIKTSWRQLQDVFWRQRRKTSSRLLQEVFIKKNVSWEVPGIPVDLLKVNCFLVVPLLPWDSWTPSTEAGYKIFKDI